MLLTITDFTSLIYSASFNINKTGSKYFEDYTNTLVRYFNNILEDTNAEAYLAFIDTKHTFRKQMYPSYKANRKNKAYFPFITDLIHFSQETLGTIKVEGLEADDLALIHANELKEDYDITIAFKDKDLLQMPCKFFDYKKYIKRISTEEATTELSREAADINLYTQLLEGDSVDNIKGIPGVGKVRATEFINNVNLEETSLFAAVKKAYTEGFSVSGKTIPAIGIEEFYKNYNLVYLLRTVHEAGLKGYPFDLFAPTLIVDTI